MKARLLLSGILLLSIVTACSDRNEEVTVPADQKKVEVGARGSEEREVISDSLKKKIILDETYNRQEDTENSTESSAETIDPTKSDRPK